MIALPNIDQISEIHSSEYSTVYEGFDNISQQKVAIKYLKEEFPSLKNIAKFNEEHDITQDIDIKGVRKAINKFKAGNKYFLILEYIEGETLRNKIDNKQNISLDIFLSYAMQIVELLGKVHEKGIIHKDINPKNILVSETRKVHLIDFGISSQIRKHTQLIESPDALEGTLPYISPEQTGRVNRSVDYRSDFYSLGITFYELISGQLPFKAKDSLEFIHAHIAKQATPLQTIKPDTPLVISEIVDKLLSKNAENRYQSAFGLYKDLEYCQTLLAENDSIPHFNIAENDLTYNLQIPEKLYGRELEISILMDVFEQSAQGNTKLALVSGFSGIGKTALVNEVHRPITAKRGYFISGKFDQFQRDVPYSAIIHAFKDFVSQILAEPSTRLNYWKNLISKAVGINGKVILDVVPNLVHVIGQQPDVPELAPAETQNRFNLVFQDFIREISRENHPLVIFIDDWQWADVGSLNFLKILMSDPTNQYLLVIGAYRDNEVDESHPFRTTIRNLKKEGVSPQHIDLHPLTENHIRKITADSLNTNTEVVSGIAKVIFQKTHGNPFFTRQFLETLSEEKELYFDIDTKHWQWDVESIKKMEITDNVVELMESKILKLPSATQNALKLAACIGNEFDLKTLALIDGRTQLEVLEDLWTAIIEGLVKPIGENYKAVDESNSDTKSYFNFLHDRVHQATYGLIDSHEKQEANLKIGRHAYANNTAEYVNEWICDIANYYNNGLSLITDNKELSELIQINWEAGKKAKKSTAYAAAVKFLSTAIQLLGEKSWQSDHTTTLAVKKLYAECQFLNINYEESEKYFEEILNNVEHIEDKLDIYTLKTIQYESIAKYQEAVEMVKEALSLLELNLPNDDNNKLSLFQDYVGKINTALEELGEIKNALNLPIIQDAKIEKIIRILAVAYGPAYMAGDMNLVLLLSALNVSYSLEHGNSNYSAWGYVAYATFVSAGLNDFKKAHKLAKTAIQLNEKYPNPALTGGIYHLTACFTNPWVNSLRDNVSLFEIVYQKCIQTGNFPYASYAHGVRTRHLFLTGEKLDVLHQKAKGFAQSLIKIQNIAIADILIVVQKCGDCLAGKTNNKFSFTDDSFNEETYLSNYQSIPIFLAVHNPLKAFTFLIYQDYDKALQYVNSSKEVISSLLGMVWNNFHNTNQSLTLCGLAKSTKNKREEYLLQVKENQTQMKRWADSCPKNFMHQYILIEAEIAFTEERWLDAMDLYDEAIILAQENEFIQYEALANELASKLYLKRGKQHIADTYLTQAHYAYQIWGAYAKAEEIATKNPNLFKRAKSSKSHNTIKIGTSSRGTLSDFHTSQNSSNSLDLETLMKATTAISKEIKLDDLLKKLIEITVENAGADKGLLFLKEDERFFLQASYIFEDEYAEVLQNTLLQENEDLPVSIINYIIRTKDNLVLNDASQESKFEDAPYLIKHKPKSVTAIPVMMQGDLVGTLYLENKNISGVFTQERITLLNLLASQIAISIDNAKLYQNMENLVAKRTEELQEKNARITDSIMYAENIQSAILPYKEDFSKLFQEHFIIYRPKDIVSGDFYWLHTIENTTLLSVIDCTGHGVPGALMSMIGNTILNEVVVQNKETDPAEILSQLHIGIRKALRQEKGVNTDGMDMGICAIQQANNSIRLTYAGAKRPLWLTKDGKFTIISGDRKAIGGFQKEATRVFTNQQIELSKGDSIYLSTDGLPDQCNKYQKKFSSKRLKQLLESYTGVAMKKQQELLENNLDVFMENEPQRDDIAILGVKF